MTKLFLVLSMQFAANAKGFSRQGEEIEAVRFTNVSTGLVYTLLRNS